MKFFRILKHYMKKIFLLSFLLLSAIHCNAQKNAKNNLGYENLVSLFQEWRTFENPPKLRGAPDYTSETFEKRQPEFEKLQKQLKAIDTTNWSIPNKVDWMLVWAEMNGYDFNHRILIGGTLARFLENQIFCNSSRSQGL